MFDHRFNALPRQQEIYYRILDIHFIIQPIEFKSNKIIAQFQMCTKRLESSKKYLLAFELIQQRISVVDTNSHSKTTHTDEKLYMISH